MGRHLLLIVTFREQPNTLQWVGRIEELGLDEGIPYRARQSQFQLRREIAHAKKNVNGEPVGQLGFNVGEVHHGVVGLSS